MDLRSSVLLHKTGGLGVKGYYPEYRVMYPSLASLYNQELKLNALKAEEERILYVALTRARDKLIMTGSIDNRPDSKGDTKLKKMAKAFVEPALAETGRQLPKDLIRKANSYLDWVFMAFARHLEGGNVLRNALGDERADMAGHDILNQVIPDRATAAIYVDIKDGSQYPSLDRRSHSSDETVDRVKAMESFHGDSLPQEVLERFNFVYQAPQAIVTPAKISVSEIKRRFQEREEEAQGLLAHEASDDLMERYQEEVSDEMGTLLDLEQEVAARKKAVANSVFGRKPAFLEEEEESLSGARWGTLMHEAMQWLPIEAYTKDSLLQALDNLVVTGRMGQEEVKQLNTYALLRFFQSDLAKRMKAASRLEKELPFSMLYDGTQVYPDLEEGEELFLQGIIDTAFLEDGQWVLVDYKTDRVDDAEELIGRYRVQLDLYGQALEQLTGIPLKETYIYSFRLHQAIQL
ncbi:MAG: PD-(D/E)XK nuclease family protein, partial [Veillonella sp.]|nr:PD-(D/E)XK nuclease family protein [Veillonella sp.]